MDELNKIKRKAIIFYCKKIPGRYAYITVKQKSEEGILQ